MTIEGMANYLGAKLLLRLDAQQHFRLLARVLVMAFLSTVIVHMLLQPEQSLAEVLVHATAIAIMYVIGIGLAVTLLYLLRNANRSVRVWHLWAASMAGFILSYYFLPSGDSSVWLIGSAASGHAEPIGFWQLLPVWALVTYLLVQPYLSDSLRGELARLREINDLLSHRASGDGKTARQMIRFASGRTEFDLDAATIRNVMVEDHYCYVFFRQAGGYGKRDLALPLRDVLALLPPGFVQVHRSHVINLDQVSSIRRIRRGIRIVLDGDFEVPVSRHRMDEVLPQLKSRGN